MTQRATTFSAPYAEADEAIAARLIAFSQPSADSEGAVGQTARALIAAIRADTGGLGGVEEMLREYSLSTKEGLALMVLAEALLRVPDAATADRLIEDKLAAGDFEHHQAKSDALLVNASAWALGLSARIIQPGETAEGIFAAAAKRIGLPAVRTAMRQAMRIMGHHFVFGENIAAALERARENSARYRYSFDMLGEGARTASDARHYFDAYAASIDAIGKSASGSLPIERPGISVKLSALHPRYEAVSGARAMKELAPSLLELARKAKSHDLNFTVDAEEADRLELSLDVIGAVFADPSLGDWDGFGIAIQAYQKRAAAVIDWWEESARAHDRRVTARLVKGAYWDTEVKRAQERGLDGYPVFTRKAMTDLNYEACARKLLATRPRIFPQFATHNALTVATVLAAANGDAGFEFQRLHGMGEALYEKLLHDRAQLACRVYAPVGGHRDLLAYLVRRLLENGANSSFVSAATDRSIPVEQLLERPAENIKREGVRHPKLPLPRDLYGARKNSRGVEFGHRESLETLLDEIKTGTNDDTIARAIIGGKEGTGALAELRSPFDHKLIVGHVEQTNETIADRAMAAAAAGFAEWSRTSVATRAATLERAADLLEERRGKFIALLQTEGGKTLDDCVSEVREAVDFCRYYASEARRLFADAEKLPGPVGESNVLRLRARGPFVAISPWNFPLAIFLGQVTAALVAGNSVIAKPAEQTPLIAAEAVRLLHEAGIPATALHFVPGDGAIGGELVSHPAAAGVVFTGSTEVARKINRALAAKDGPIVPLIAETGGINAMIVDATALPEQVADDAVTSAFRSAGQRCSALRILFVQEDVADRMIEMIAGAAAELKLGDPRDPAAHVGPVIDAEAKKNLDAHIAAMKRTARLHYAGTAPEQGTFVAPHLFEIADAGKLKEEVFGPILHVVRYRAERLDGVLDAIARTGFGLTLGVHSRIGDTAERVADRLNAGNVYVNRNMIGAVVGVQPFGGSGLSGTGPKAGGPQYLQHFATEQTVTVNIAAAGGDANLLSMDD